jgi:hypothetical protein
VLMDPSAFGQLISRPLGDLELASPPHRCRPPPPPALASQHSARLAKKSCNHTTAIVAAQNVLIRKLGLVLGSQMDTMTFEKYLKLFQEGLSEEQAQMIAELFATQLPVPEAQVVDVVEAWCCRIKSLVIGRSSCKMGSENYLCWNVRGLNSGARRDSVRELVWSEQISLVCLQVTKLDVISDYDIMQILGPDLNWGWFAWESAVWTVSCSSTRTFSISIKIRPSAGGLDWWLTSVYEPAREEDKPAFLAELHELRVVRTGAWMINEDFNLIYRAEDKNNTRLNRRLMGHFW